MYNTSTCFKTGTPPVRLNSDGGRISACGAAGASTDTRPADPTLPHQAQGAAAPHLRAEACPTPSGTR